MKNKIVFFTNRMTKGGSERVISYLANGLCEEIDVDIITMTCAKSDYFLNEKVNHIPLEDKKAKNNHSIFTNIKRLKNLKKYIKQNQNATYISFVTLPSYIILLYRKLIKGKIIVTVRNDPKECHKHFYDKILVKLLYPRADAMVFQTKQAEEYYKNIRIKKSIILPNPINEKFLKEPYRGKREKIIVNVGRLIKQKNQILLIKAFAEVHKKYNDYKLFIYGTGKLENVLQDYINENNLHECVKLKGQNSKLEEEIHNKAMFVLSSDFEGMPNALLEAMSLGLPSISTKASGGGPETIINNYNNGILVSVGNEEELYKAMIYVIENTKESEKMATNAYNYCREKTPEQIINLWRSFIKEVNI